MDYLQQHKDTLIPEFRQVWEAAGFKTSGTWEEVFGKGVATDEIFMAWNYARYIGRVADGGQSRIPDTDERERGAAQNVYHRGLGREGTRTRKSGEIFAIGGPMDDLMDVWRAGAPRIDILSPDIYSDRDFVAWCARYSRSGNPLFIPETRNNMEAKAMYVFGRHDAVGLSLMGVERAADSRP